AHRAPRVAAEQGVSVDGRQRRLGLTRLGGPAQRTVFGSQPFFAAFLGAALALAAPGSHLPAVAFHRSLPRSQPILVLAASAGAEETMPARASAGKPQAIPT